MADDLAAAARRMAKLGAALDAASWLVSTHNAIGKAGKGYATHHGGTMHRWNKRAKTAKPVRLTAGYDADRRSVTIKGRPVGFWVIRESGAARHEIPTPGKVKSRKRRVVAYGAGNVYAHVDHPGAPAEHRWTDVRTDTNRAAPRIVDDHVAHTLASLFGGS